MKTNIFLLALCLSAISVMGQQNHRKPQIGQNHFHEKVNFTTSEPQNGVIKFQKKEKNIRVNNQSKQRLKSANIVKQGLDSVVYEIFDENSGTLIREGKDEYTYDSNGNLVSEIYLNYDETMKKAEYAYDSNGYVTLEIEYRLDEISNIWIRDVKTEYTLGSNGKWTLVIINRWDEAIGDWIADSKKEYEFDPNGNLILEVHYMWDNTTSEWVVNIKIENGYDSNGNLTIHSDYNSTADKVTRKEENSYYSSGKLKSTIEYTLDETTGKWVVKIKIDFTYDSIGNLSSDIIYHWDETTNDWVEHNKDEYAYDSNGNRTSYYYSVWNEITSNWVNRYKSEYTYGSNGNPVSGSSYEWDEATNEWAGSSTWEDGYDSYGNLTFISEYTWDETTGNWVGWKEETIYDYNYLAKDLILPDWFQDENMKHKITDVLHYSTNEDTGGLYVEGRGKFFYSDKTITGIDNNEIELVQVYPNPASSTLYIKGLAPNVAVSIFDLNGLLIGNKQLNGNQMDISELANGVYILKVSNHGKPRIMKFIKQ